VSVDASTVIDFNTAAQMQAASMAYG